MAGLYAYDHTDSNDEDALTLRSGGEGINNILEEQINERLSIAGIEVVEARINYLAYAPEIAAVMLRRQQADAIIAAREKIVEGAVGMVKMALTKLSKDRDTGNANPATSIPGGAPAGTLGKGNADLFSTGVILGYITDPLYGLSFGATFQGNYAPFADKDAKNLYAPDMYGSGAVLSEAYVTYTLGKTTAKVGRQFIASPLVNSSGSRMIKEAFQAAVLINKHISTNTSS